MHHRKEIIKYDMHVHSALSDGTYTYRELIDIASSFGLKGISITDHDVISKEIVAVKSYAREKGIHLIHGLEFSTQFSNVHILAYNIDLSQEGLWEYLKVEQAKRYEAVQEMCLRAKKKGMDIDFEEVLVAANNGTLGRPHIAAVLQQKGYVKDIYEAFHKYLKKGQSVYAGYKKHHHTEIVRKILEWKGIPVLAHLALVAQEIQDDVFQECREEGLRGLEAYYPRFNEQQTNKLLELAQKHGLLISGGSDFHGTNKSDIELASAGLTEENFQNGFGRLAI